jgi:hypothetical protein
MKLPGSGLDFEVTSDGKNVANSGSHFEARFVVIDNLFK